MSWRHDVVDFAIDAQGNGACKPCGSVTSTSGGLPALQLQRIHKYRSIHNTGWFGPGVFSNYEDFLVLDRKKASGAGNIRMVDHLRFGDFMLKDSDEDGFYQDKSFRTIKETTLLDAGGSIVVEMRDAVTVVLERHDGTQRHYEVFNRWGQTEPNQLFARLTAEVDRNGNQTTIAYQFAADATDTELGNDRSKLWMAQSVTDAYGRTMTIQYDMSAKISGKYVVSTITVPVGAGTQDISYTYNLDGSIVDPTTPYPISGPSQVDFPDGTQSTFSLSLDAADQHQVLHVNDAAAEGTHRRKDVHLTLSDYVEPGTDTILAQSGRLVREVYNGAGERQFALWASEHTYTSGNADQVHYVYNLGKFWRYISRGGYPVARHNAISTNFSLPVSDWQDGTGWEWKLTSNFGHDTQRWITANTDALGRKTRYSLNPVSGRKDSITYPDNTEVVSEFNAFSQPIFRKDREGRVTTWTYDATGNKLSETVGQRDDNDDKIAEAVPGLTATRSWTYTPAGQLASETDFNGNTTDYFYSSVGSPSAIDNYGYLVKIQEPADVAGGTRAEVTFTYDASGRRTQSTDAEGRQASYAYDTRNRISSITYFDGSVESYVYGTGTKQNLLVQQTDRNGNVTTIDYDDHGRRIETIVAANDGSIADVEQCTWLPGTVLKATCTRLGETKTYGYDWRLRRVDTVTQVNGSTTLADSVTYDVAGRVIVRTDAYGRSAYPVYDTLDYTTRMVQDTVPGGVTGALGLAAGTVPTQTQLGALLCDASDNAAYLITDSVYNDDRQRIASVDGRGIVDLYTYDGRKRRITTIKNGAQIAANTTLDDIQAQTWIIMSILPSLKKQKPCMTRKATSPPFAIHATLIVSV
jgi:YD repeat-containing protein